MSRVKLWGALAVLAIVAGIVGWRMSRTPAQPEPIVVYAKNPPPADRVRETLFADVQPVALANCELKRFGEANDGGYLLCANLLGAVRGGYSYGISGYDGWGCQVSRDLHVKVHQYDCFNLTEPVCEGGKTVFHAECVAGKPSTDEAGRLFDTPEHQIVKNGDIRRQLVVKMDVEGAEWETFLHTPDAVFNQIDQLVVEFHGVNRQRFVDAIGKLKKFFYVANLHFNNYSCTAVERPFPAWAFEVLFVNKRIGVLDASGRKPAPSALDRPNNPNTGDCQS